jgi:hypothetical protein
MNHWVFLIIGIMGLTTIASGSLPSAFAQTQINVTSGGGDPCFLNYTAGVHMWENCGVEQDWVAMTLLPFQWVTGGIFSIIIVSVIIFMVYMKYETAIYPLAIGIIMLPLSYFAFPDQFIIFAIVLAFIAVGSYIWYILIRQTKEY